MNLYLLCIQLFVLFWFGVVLFFVVVVVLGRAFETQSAQGPPEMH